MITAKNTKLFINSSLFRQFRCITMAQEVLMENVLPIIIVCGVGIALSLAYIVALCVKAIRTRPRRKHEFEIEENVLTIKLGRRKKK